MLLDYVQAGIAEKCKTLEEVLGGRSRAAAVVFGAPDVLILPPASIRSNVAFLQQLGWTGEEVEAFIIQHISVFRLSLTGPAMQRLLELCSEVLGLSPDTLLRQHPNSLLCAPQSAVVRLCFLRERGLQGLATLDVLGESSGGWSHRLLRWGKAHIAAWPGFVARFRRKGEGFALAQQLEAYEAERKAAAAARKR